MKTVLLRMHSIESVLLNKYLQLTIFYILLFLIPFLLKGPQILIGITINFLLVVGISEFKFKEIIPALFLPSISVYIYGILFGGATIFLLYLIPLISIANGIYILVFRNSKQKFLGIILASFLKSIFLFICAYILFKAVGLPEVFLTSMGIIQLLTALTGGFFATILLNNLRLR